VQPVVELVEAAFADRGIQNPSRMVERVVRPRQVFAVEDRRFPEQRREEDRDERRDEPETDVEEALGRRPRTEGSSRGPAP
jgi:hypothetical protein